MQSMEQAQEYEIVVLADGVELPNGHNYDTGEVVRLNFEEFQAIALASFGTKVDVRAALSPLDPIATAFFGTRQYNTQVQAFLSMSDAQDAGDAVCQFTIPLREHPLDDGVLGSYLNTCYVQFFTVVPMGMTAAGEVDLKVYAQPVGGGALRAIGDPDAVYAIDGSALFLPVSPDVMMVSDAASEPGTDAFIKASTVTTPFDPEAGSDTYLAYGTLSYSHA